MMICRASPRLARPERDGDLAWVDRSTYRRAQCPKMAEARSQTPIYVLTSRLISRRSPGYRCKLVRRLVAKIGGGVAERGIKSVGRLPWSIERAQRVVHLGKRINRAPLWT